MRDAAYCGGHALEQHHGHSSAVSGAVPRFRLRLSSNYVVYPNTSSSFAATWTAPAQAAWQVTINATATGVASGPSYPSSVVDASTTLWNFSALRGGSGAGGGFLPTGTFVAFGDLDAGSGSNEQFVLKAFNLDGSTIQTPWLDSPSYISSNDPSDLVTGSLPEYVWDPAGIYTFDGAMVTGNPTLTVWLTNNAKLYGLSVEKFTTNNGFFLAAPTAAPEPTTFVLLGAGLATFAYVKKRRHKSLS